MYSARIRELRDALDLTQTEFGRRLGVSRSVINNLERGVTVPNVVFLDHMCDIFNCKKRWLETGDGEMFDSSAPTPEENRIVEAVSSSPAMQSLFAAYDQLDDTGRAVFEEYVCRFVEDYHRRQGERNEARNAEPFSQPDPYPEEESI